VQAVSGLLYLVMAGIGGLWIPVDVMPAALRGLAVLTPAYWAGQVARGPLSPGDLNPAAVAVTLAWAVGLAAIGVYRFRVDTARV
jgi:ABC-2 type transport system permease protein